MTAYYVFSFVFLGLGLLAVFVGMATALFNKNVYEELAENGRNILKAGLVMTVASFAWPVALPAATAYGVYKALKT